jgi:hypothetical protein
MKEQTGEHRERAAFMLEAKGTVQSDVEINVNTVCPEFVQSERHEALVRCAKPAM